MTQVLSPSFCYQKLSPETCVQILPTKHQKLAPEKRCLKFRWFILTVKTPQVQH